MPCERGRASCLVFVYFYGMTAEEIKVRIHHASPLLAESSEVFSELINFFLGESKIVPNFGELPRLLAPHRLFRVIRVCGSSIPDCAVRLIDEHPEFTCAKGMLRYYRCPPGVNWRDVERAEDELSNAMLMDVYGWAPDGFTLFETADAGKFELVAILAF